ncbi:MAG TPA: hypothetical protein VF334_23615 [Polyangia bacterium]
MGNSIVTRTLWVALCGVAAAGCFPRGGGGGGDDGPSYTLFADDAEVGAVNHAGQPWCADGATPAVSLVATLSSTTAESSAQTSLTPSWREPLLDATLADFSAGLGLDVRGRCDDGTSFFMGRARLHPDATMVEGGGVALGPIGNVTRLRVHFEANEPAGGGSTVDDPAFGYDDGDYGTYVPDPGDVSDDGSDSSDPTDDGTADGSDDGSGDCGCVDDGGSDDGGDDGGDDGSDGYRRLHHGNRSLSARRTGVSNRNSHPAAQPTPFNAR